jgi:ATP-binding cassette subfamily B protein
MGKFGGAFGKLLTGAIKQRRWLFAGVMVAQVVAMIAGLVQPTLNSLIIDNGVVAGDIPYVERVGAVMFAVAVVNFIGSMLAVALGSRLSTGVAKDLRSRIYRHSMTLSANQFHQVGTASMMTRTMQDVTVTQQSVFMVNTVAATGPLITVGAIVMSLRMSVRMSPVIAVAAILMAIVVGMFIARITPLAVQSRRAVDGLNHSLREQLSGTQVIRAFGREKLVSARFAESNDRLTALSRRVGALQALLMPVVLVVANLTMVVTNLVGAKLIDSGHLTIGELTAFSGYLVQVVGGVTMLMAAAAVIPQAQASAGRIADVLETDTETVSGPAGNRPTFAAPIEFVGTTVQYPGAELAAVSDVSFTCAAGEVTVVVGGTASGKSTLMALLPRLVDPTIGAVRAGGVDLRHWSMPDLRARISYVSQEGSLISGSVAGNLRLAGKDATDDELWRALEVAEAAGFVRERGGLTTEVGQAGSNFSGGQRQRLALARAVLRGPQVYVIDDGFSAMDPRTATRVLKNLRAAAAEATIIIAAQQITMARVADRIAVIDGGRLVATGDHLWLLDRCLPYREMVEAQSGVVR